MKFERYKYRYAEIWLALEELVKLHAKLLDKEERKSFKDADAWIKKLREAKK